MKRNNGAQQKDPIPQFPPPLPPKKKTLTSNIPCNVVVSYGSDHFAPGVVFLAVFWEKTQRVQSTYMVQRMVSVAVTPLMVWISIPYMDT